MKKMEWREEIVVLESIHFLARVLVHADRGGHVGQLFRVRLGCQTENPSVIGADHELVVAGSADAAALHARDALLARIVVLENRIVHGIVDENLDDAVLAAHNEIENAVVRYVKAVYWRDTGQTLLVQVLPFGDGLVKRELDEADLAVRRAIEHFATRLAGIIVE